MATPSTPDMQITPQRAKQLLENLATVTRQIQAANQASRPIRLTAISKLHPASAIIALHQTPPSSPPSPAGPPSPHPLLHFGENYAQELTTKASVLPRSIKWHFIGALQSNKCKALAEIPNLWTVESVDTVKKADLLEKGRREWAARVRGKKKGERKEAVETEGKVPLPKEEEEEEDDDETAGAGTILRVFVQVNTSGEASKSGLEPGAPVLELCTHVRAHCPHLKLQGLMTIGAIARSVESASEGAENEDFRCLRQERDRVQGLLGGEALELSMGMSGDFESAIRCGSDEVRVGSGIFGERPRREDAVV